jgi:glycosyltransferase involved in cell wall biosynthesis
MHTIRLYGFTNGYGSYAQVTSGFEEGLRALGATDDTLEVVSLDSGDRDDHEPRLQLASEAILTGPPHAWSVMFQNAQHDARSVMVAPNSDTLPSELMTSLTRSATRILVPSAWAKPIVEKYTTLPVHVVSHGVPRAFSMEKREVKELDAAYEAGEFKVLHLTSTSGQRKGTAELIRAWRFAQDSGYIPRLAKLLIIATPQARMLLVTEGLISESVIIVDRVNGSPLLMNQIYGRVHALCQPSRAEGFGLTPLEARAAGCPVIATECTGHSEHMTPEVTMDQGVVTVPHIEDGPVDDLPGARAPMVTVDDIVSSLRIAHLRWRELNDNAIAHSRRVSEDWSWQRRLVLAGLW